MRTTIWASFLLSVLTNGPSVGRLDAQESRFGGFFVGAGANVMHANADTLPATSGFGLSVAAGVNAPGSMFVLNTGLAIADSGLIGYAALTVRRYLKVTSSVAALGELSIEAHGREISNDRLLLGTGWALAGGAEAFIAPRRSISVVYTRWTGQYDEIAYESTRVKLGANSSRISVSYNFRSRP